MPFVKLDCGMLDSSIWVDREARELFITALLMAVPYEAKEPLETYGVMELKPTGFMVPPGWYGKVNAAGIGIVRRALLDDEPGLRALVRLGEPEPQSRSSDFEGRRLVRVDGGYIVLNFWAYRAKDHTSAERSKRYRAKKSKKSQKKVADEYEARERRYVRAFEQGDEQQADQIAAEGL